MAVNANANKTFDLTTIREDLQDALTSISPTETPFMSAIGTRDVNNTYFEWPVVDLAAPDSANRVLEGEASPNNDAPTNAKRLGNYVQLSDKVAEVTSTAEAVEGVSNVQRMAKQIAYKLREMKRDMEVMLCGVNVAAVAGAAATARQTASLSAFLRTNVSRGASGASGTLSGTTEGYPNAAATDGTLRALTETILNDVIASCWTEGAEPSLVLCGAGVKRKISSTFTGAATRYKNVEDKKVVAAIDLYVSDFGELQIVPSRWVRSRDVFVLDPSYARVAWLAKTKQEPLAKTGHSERRLLSAQYGLMVDTEKAHGIVADINPAL